MERLFLEEKELNARDMDLENFLVRAGLAGIKPAIRRPCPPSRTPILPNMERLQANMGRLDVNG